MHEHLASMYKIEALLRKRWSLGYIQQLKVRIWRQFTNTKSINSDQGMHKVRTRRRGGVLRQLR